MAAVETRSRIASALRAMAKMRGLTARSVVQACPGISERSMGAYFRGERDVPGERLDSICAAMGCSVAQLLALAAAMDPMAPSATG